MGGIATVLVIAGLILFVMNVRIVAAVILFIGFGLFIFLHFQAKKEKAQLEEGKSPKTENKKIGNGDQGESGPAES
jgi:predicted membrane protein